MKKFLQKILFPALFCLNACSGYLDPQQLSIINESDLYRNINYIEQIWVQCYSYLPDGHNFTLWAASDEADAVEDQHESQKFNLGNWSRYDMPDNMWSHYYKGIKQCCELIENLQNVTWEEYRVANPSEYERRTTLMSQYIVEARFLRAYYYFELVKRYGGVPIVTHRLYLNDADDLYFVKTVKRNTFAECIDFIVKECDAVAPLMESSFDLTWKGRATSSAAKALKSRVLLYAASDLFNIEGNTNPLVGYTSGNRTQRWLDAALAANELIRTDAYRLHGTYRELFTLESNSGSREIIWGRQAPAVNTLEKALYPIGYDGGNSGVCPTGDLVDAYEMSNGTLFSWDNPSHAANPFGGRDARLKATVLVNGDKWAGRAVEAYEGGRDGKPVRNATRTGFYMKKHLVDGLNLVNDYKASREWIYFRYAEILLNYAEAVNHYAGPDFTPGGCRYTAKEAVNLIRTRALQPLCDVTFSRRGTPLNRDSFAEFVLNERRVELAFEDMRIWDLKRNMQAEAAIGGNIHGVKITKSESGEVSYARSIVEKRVFSASKMYFYPIPQSEISKSDGNLEQNPGW